MIPFANGLRLLQAAKGVCAGRESFTGTEEFRPDTDTGERVAHRNTVISIFIVVALGACSDGSRGPLDLGEPILSGTETFIDFEEFADGDTVTSSQGVPISLLRRGRRCADAITALDSGVPHGSGEDDLDLSSPNETFGGLGQGAGGERGRKYENGTPLGNVLIIQEDPAVRDDHPGPGDNCADGGLIGFDFTALSPTGVAVKSIILMDVDNRKEADRIEIRLYGPAGQLLLSKRPPVTGSNGVVNLKLGPTQGVTRLEVDQGGGAPIAMDTIDFVVPEPTEPDSTG